MYAFDRPGVATRKAKLQHAAIISKGPATIREGPRFESRRVGALLRGVRVVLAPERRVAIKHDTGERVTRRFPAVEGRLYLVGGFAATYLRRGNIVLIPIRLGVGYRAGVNVGYMKITHKAKWLPF